MKSGAAYFGPLYLEIVPRSFAIKVKTGYSLNQICFVRGDAAVSDRSLQMHHMLMSLLLYHNLLTKNRARTPVISVRIVACFSASI